MEKELKDIFLHAFSNMLVMAGWKLSHTWSESSYNSQSSQMAGT